MLFQSTWHHHAFMAYDVSASQNLDSELPLRIFPPDLLIATDWFDRRHHTHWAVALIASFTMSCCSPILIVKNSSNCFHRGIISAYKFIFFDSGMEPAFFHDKMSTAA